MWPDERESDPTGETEPPSKLASDARSDDSLDDVFRLLSHRERRYALYYLHSADEDAASFGELADYVVARDADSVADLEDGDGTLERLHETHLPKLDDAGVVEYDRQSGDVAYRGSPLLERGLALAHRWEDD